MSKLTPEAIADAIINLRTVGPNDTQRTAIAALEAVKRVRELVAVTRAEAVEQNYHPSYLLGLSQALAALEGEEKP